MCEQLFLIKGAVYLEKVEMIAVQCFNTIRYVLGNIAAFDRAHLTYAKKSRLKLLIFIQIKTLG